VGLGLHGWQRYRVAPGGVAGSDRPQGPSRAATPTLKRAEEQLTEARKAHEQARTGFSGAERQQGARCS